MKSTRPYFLLASLAFPSLLPAQDIVEAVRKATEPRDPILEGKAPKPKPFEPIVPSKNPAWEAKLDPAWQRSTLYQNPKNPRIQELAITGLWHLNATAGNAEVKKAEDFDQARLRNRRLRLGARMKAFYHTTVHVDADLDSEFQYRSLNDAKFTTQFHPQHRVSVGRMKAPFSREWTQDSQDLRTPERSPLVNQLAPQRSLGIYAEGQINPAWSYGAGLFSGDANAEFGQGGKPFFLANIAYDFSQKPMKPAAAKDKYGATDKDPVLPSTRERWYLNYIHNFKPEGSDVIGADRADVVRPARNSGQALISEDYEYRHLLASGFIFEQDRLQFESEVLWARGDLASVWGLQLTPSFWVLPGTLEAVGRYAYAGSNQEAGLLYNLDPSRDFVLSNRYFVTGDEMHSFTLATNYYPYASQWIFQAGAQFDTITNESNTTRVWTYFLGSKLEF